MEKTIEKEFNLKESFVLWKNTSKEGKAYFTGQDSEKHKLTGFYNTNKKNPKEPDLRVIDKEDKEFASLWCNVDKKEKKYLSGALKTDGKRIVGFFAKEENEKRPFIRVYLSEDKREEVKEKATSKTSKKADVKELPF